MIFLPFIINIYKKINTQYKKNYSAKKVNKKIQKSNKIDKQVKEKNNPIALLDSLKIILHQKVSNIEELKKINKTLTEKKKEKSANH